MNLAQHLLYEAGNTIAVYFRLGNPDVIGRKERTTRNLEKIEVGKKNAMGENMLHTLRQKTKMSIWCTAVQLLQQLGRRGSTGAVGKRGIERLPQPLPDIALAPAMDGGKRLRGSRLPTPYIYIGETARLDLKLALLHGQLLYPARAESLTALHQRTIGTTGRQRRALQGTKIHDALIVG